MQHQSQERGDFAQMPSTLYNDEMGFDFSGKLAVVTGGANGIGAATARMLARGGARVAIFDLERVDAAVAAQLRGVGYAVDVTDRASL
jgi:NAD(P)-dependent dehydrogenase (short-subunit alcohol dehydrogenase family)